MSGRTKRTLYNITDIGLWIGMIAGACLMLYFSAPRPLGAGEWTAWFLFLAAILLRLPAAVHEIGHLLFGWLAGMKCAGVTLSYLRISDGRVGFTNPNFAGAAEMYPKNGKGTRGKVVLFTLGGALFSLAAGGVLLALFLVLPYSAGLLFCGLFSLPCLYEGVRALLPAELPAGKTDGAVLLGILNRSPEEEVMLRVMRAQGLLFRLPFSEIPEALFDAPVVREDLPAYHALLFLKMQWQLDADVGAAEPTFGRLKSLEAYMNEGERAELGRYAAAFGGNFRKKKSPFRGVRMLEEKLSAK